MFPKWWKLCKQIHLNFLKFDIVANEQQAKNVFLPSRGPVRILAKCRLRFLFYSRKPTVWVPTTPGCEKEIFNRTAENRPKIIIFLQFPVNESFYTFQLGLCSHLIPKQKTVSSNNGASITCHTFYSPLCSCHFWERQEMRKRELE